MSDQKPSVGRIVHFYNLTTPPNRNGAGAGPYAAIVTQNNDDPTYINLKVIAYGDMWDEGSVSEKGSGNGRYWEWPPRV